MSTTNIPKPMKAHDYESHRMRYPCWGQPKLDGLRAIYYEGHLYSGDRKQWNDVVVSHILEPLKDCPLMLDGELYRHGWKLQSINSAIGVNRNNPNNQTGNVQFHVFDCVDNDSFNARRQWILKVVSRIGNPAIQLVTAVQLNDESEANTFYSTCLRLGYEGCIYRLPDFKYHPGRTWNMLKRKELRDAEFRVVGVQEGRATELGSKFLGSLGALVCATEDGKQFCVGTGFSDFERAIYWRNPPIGKLLRVKFRCLSADGIPIEPRSMGLRDYA